MGTLETAASGMRAQQYSVDIISNNLANVNTTAYKKQRAEFQDTLYETLQKGGVPEKGGKAVGVQIGHGTILNATLKSFAAGNMEQTDNPLDLFIDGDGFFEVKGADGQSYYTRDGSFKLGATLDGTFKLVTKDGSSVLDAGGNEITINAKEPSKITIQANGIITYVDTDGNSVTSDQPLQVMKFLNPAGLENKGTNMYKKTEASGEPKAESEEASSDTGMNEMSTIRQGFLESSNVSVVDEMVKMISAQRAYEINSKAVQAADEMLGMASNLRR